MNTNEIIDTANHCTMQRLLARYFSERTAYASRQIEGTTITVEPSRHRNGLPADTACRRYVFTHVTEGWTIVARSVWRNGRLLQAAATHTRIDHYLDDDGRHGNDEATVAVAFNAWLLTLDL